MKVNANFNAGATKKTTSETADLLAAAINSNFEANKTSQVQSVQNEVSSESQTQAQKTSSEKAETAENQVTETQQKTETSAKKETKRNLSREKSDTFPVYLAQGERAPYKAFCAIQNVSMNHFVVCAMDYFKQEIESGKVEITKHGYKRHNGD